MAAGKSLSTTTGLRPPLRLMLATVVALCACGSDPGEASYGADGPRQAVPTAGEKVNITELGKGKPLGGNLAAALDGPEASLASIGAGLNDMAAAGRRFCARPDLDAGHRESCAAAGAALRRAAAAREPLLALAAQRELRSPDLDTELASEAAALWQDPGHQDLWLRVGEKLARMVLKARQEMGRTRRQGAELGAEAAAANALAALDHELTQQLFQRPGEPPVGGFDATEVEAIQAKSAAKRARYHFTNGWFDGVRPGWEQATLTLRQRPLRILELGSFEGAATTWLLDELACDRGARVTAVDTFGGSMEHQPDSGVDYRLTSLRQRFDDNVGRSEHKSQLRVMATTTQEALHTLYDEGARFDFVYIDASHTSPDVLADAVNVWPLVEVGGTIVFDDYHWTDYLEDLYNPGAGIDAFLHCYALELRYAVKNGQVWLFKTSNVTPATLR